MDYDSELEDESTLAKKLQMETEITATKEGKRSIRDPCDVMYGLWDQITLAEKLQLETEIRAIKQGGRSVEELFYDMASLWDQMDPRDLTKSSSYRKFQEENHLMQFLLALRDEFVPFRRSLLSRDLVPSLKQAVTELKAEEARLNSSSGYLEGEITVEDNDGAVSMFSSLSMNTEENHEPAHSGSEGTACNAPEFAAASPPAIAEVSDHFDGSGGSHLCKDSSTVTILTYNVCIWNVEMHERMKALCSLIQLHKPDIICFQEVTLNSYNIFKQSSWWNEYDCSVSLEEATDETRTPSHFCMQLSKLPVKSFSFWPFRNSSMGRELCMADIQVCRGKSLIVATSHLESPDVFRQMYSKERVAQAKKSVKCLQSFQNVIFSGDMNWNDEREGLFPLPEGWVDAWRELRPWLRGWTCDTNSNPMLIANRPLQLRPDRFLCKLNDFKLVKISMIGTEPIPGVSYVKEKRMKSTVQTLKLPVLPSDHYGLLLEICGK